MNMKRILTSFLGLSALLVMSTGMLSGGAVLALGPLSSSPVVADITNAKSDACAGIGLAGGGCGDNGSGLSQALSAIISVFSAIVGVVAAIMIIIAGLRFITSNGDTSKISGAKSAITYAIIGLVIVALSQAIVHFVLGKATGN